MSPTRILPIRAARAGRSTRSRRYPRRSDTSSRAAAPTCHPEAGGRGIPCFLRLRLVESGIPRYARDDGLPKPGLRRRVPPQPVHQPPEPDVQSVLAVQERERGRLTDAELPPHAEQDEVVRSGAEASLDRVESVFSGPVQQVEVREGP